jgi:two-component system, OmpR family, response regulator
MQTSLLGGMGLPVGSIPKKSITYGTVVFGLRVAFLSGMNERILIIDDDRDLAKAYAEYLCQCGYQVDCAHELEEAQSLLAHFAYSVVVTDLRLTKLGFGGLDLLKHIRQLGLDSRIIVFTGYGWPEVKEEVLAQKVDAFIQKPAQLARLADTIGELAGVKDE